MKLLHWATLHPQGSSNLAAIRFSAAVSVKLIRIFGPNERLFANDPDILRQVQYPDSHEEVVVTMRLLFTAAPLVTPDAADKPKPSNQLATTKINYDGGTREFKIDMENHSTRLMMLITWLPKITVAVYGDLVSDLAPEAAPVSSKSNEITTTPLPLYLNVAYAQDPMSLAKSLCSEVVGEISTLHLLRLMFLLKPADADWDIPGYPVKYADIVGNIPELVNGPMDEEDLVHPKQRWLEQVMEELRFPIHDKESRENIGVLTDSLATALEAPVRIYFFLSNRKITGHDAKLTGFNQARVDWVILIEGDLSTGGALVEKMILCAANPSFASHLAKPTVMEKLKSMREGSDPQQDALLAALISRVEGWKTFEQSLQSEDVPFSQVTSWIYAILGDEESFAIFIQGLVVYEPISKLLKAVPTSNVVQPLFSNCPPNVALSDRLAFVRAIIGISGILPIFCWANSEGKHNCLQRVIHAFLIWQMDPGYSVILNRVLSLKQCIWRLFMTVKDYTQGTSLGAERLLYQLYRSNTEVLFHPTFANYLTSRTDDWLPLSDNGWLIKATITAQQGMKGVLQLLFAESTFPDGLGDPNAVYLLRVLVEYLNREVDAGNEEAVFKALWNSEPPLSGLVPSLIGHLTRVASTLHAERWPFSSLPRAKQDACSDLFIIADGLLSLISHFAQTLPPVSRDVDQLARALIHLQTACNLATTKDVSPLSSIIQRVQAMIVEILLQFKSDQFSPRASTRLLESLLLYSQYPSGHDPVSEFAAVTSILSSLLPTTQATEDLLWGRRIIGQLPLVRAFLQRIGGPQRAKWISRLIELDKGETGLELSLLSEEIAQLQLALDRLQEAESNQPLDYALQFEIAGHLECLAEISEGENYDIVAQLMAGRLTEKLAKCYASLSHLRLHNESSVRLAKHLLKSNQKHLRVAAICTLFREARATDGAPMPDVLGLLRSSGTFLNADIDLLITEIGYRFSAMSTRSSLSTADARAILALMEWLTSTSKEAFIPTLTYNSFQNLQKLVQASIHDQANNLASMSSEVHFGDDEPMEDAPFAVLTISTQGLTPAQIAVLVESQGQPRTPPRHASHPALGLVTTSPRSVNRSPIITNLTKTYLNNDFRQMRNSPLGRHNTSRPPSIHVDDFVAASSPLGSVGTRSVHSQASAQSSPAIPHAPFNSFIPGLQ
ncbi:hypothetical protein M408DRAFT_315059 [Serendipita vermifera MAFF 305830]|uniref:Virilizer N-terminal domain-containing protein n=1 Tax=Serendipita vermifera MAFF 305830 TaxID=933852 RepID=A0A0C2WGH6_SERVB|nr:hypothetical protein M408DRAFT_315059 [Serendipita vermifera MAFF 305830]